MFFGFGAFVCLVTIIALLFPGGFLEPIWRLNPAAQHGFQELGHWSIVLMLVVGTVCAFAALGLNMGLEWGRQLAIGILVVNLVGDSVNAVARHDLKTLIGLPIGGAMILYLLGRRRYFQRPRHPKPSARPSEP